MRIVEVNSTNLLSFKKKKDLTKWVISIFEQQRSVRIASSGLEVYFGNMAAKRDTIKQDYKNIITIAIYSEIQALLKNAQYKEFIQADEKHAYRVKGQYIYHSHIKLDEKKYRIEIKIDVPLEDNNTFNYASSKIIKM
ncbi:MAG: hypothetical protein LBJ74_01870 [Heliobacteriaceae bacterium]|jgi:hypothetical protein|nr:hypothetical protein [Heliobacteriaceae bacterium]